MSDGSERRSAFLRFLLLLPRTQVHLGNNLFSEGGGGRSPGQAPVVVDPYSDHRLGRSPRLLSPARRSEILELPERKGSDEVVVQQVIGPPLSNSLSRRVAPDENEDGGSGGRAI